MNNEHRYNWDSSKVLNVLLLGAGGNGSEIYEGLVKIHQALLALGGEGLNVIVMDDDIVANHNVIRQRYYPHEVGLHKSITLVNRSNLLIGTCWQALTRRFDEDDVKLLSWCDLVITAVDSLQARRSVHIAAQKLSNWATSRYWLDLGVDKDQGQVIFGGLWHASLDDGMPNVIAHYPEILTLPEVHNRPSCSAADSLSRQALFVNASAALAALQLLWSGLRKGVATTNSVYFNLSESRQAGFAGNIH